MSIMNSAPRHTLLVLILLCCSTSGFAASLITYPLGNSTDARSRLDFPSGSVRLSLSGGPAGVRYASVDASNGPIGDRTAAPAGIVGMQNGPQSADGRVGSVGSFPSDQGSAQLGKTTSEVRSTGPTADIASVEQVKTRSDGPIMDKTKLPSDSINGADGSARLRIPAADPAGTDRATPGQLTSGAVSSGASHAAGSLADSTSGSHFSSNTRSKGTTDTTSQVPSQGPSIPNGAVQAAAAAPGQSSSVASSQASQVLSSPQGTAASIPSGLSPSGSLNPVGAAPTSSVAVPPTGASGSASSANATERFHAPGHHRGDCDFGWRRCKSTAQHFRNSSSGSDLLPFHATGLNGNIFIFAGSTADSSDCGRGQQPQPKQRFKQ
jgi:hypothetical protein